MKNLKLFMLAVFAMVSMIFATASMAQTNTTGSVEGTVVDTTGAVVPNVAVTIAGPNLISPQTVTSNAEGSYRFLQLPPGRYVVTTAAAAGFGAFKQENVDVSLGQTASVRINLSAKGVGEVVDVVASSEI